MRAVPFGLAFAVLSIGCGARSSLVSGTGGEGGGAVSTTAGEGGTTSMGGSTTGGGAGGSGTTSAGGAGEPCNGLSCVDLGFECGSCVVDTSGCGDKTHPWAGWNTDVPPQDGDVIATLGTVGELTASCSSNGGKGANKPVVEVGDKNSQSSPGCCNMQGEITYDLGGLPPGAKVVSATAFAWQTAAVGAAYSPPMTKVVLRHQRGCTPDSPTFAFAERDFSTDPADGWRSADVTDAVRMDLAMCQTRTQLRLEFSPSNTSGQKNSYAAFASDNAPVMDHRPYLAIRYRTE